MCKKWRERACKEHMDEIIEGVIRSNDVQAMRELTWYDGAVRDPRLHAALAEHPQANLDTLRHLVSFARNDALRQAWRRIGLLLSSPKEKALNKIKELKDLWSSLERLNEEGVNDLRAEDFAPLLQAEDPELRMETIRLLAHLQGATETRPTPAQPKPLQSRRGQHTKA